MPNFVVECESGVEALVTASTLTRAQADWDELVRDNSAEPGMARHPRHGEVREIARNTPEHDYR